VTFSAGQLGSSGRPCNSYCKKKHESEEPHSTVDHLSVAIIFLCNLTGLPESARIVGNAE
jgi:hypothetical protein